MAIKIVMKWSCGHYSEHSEVLGDGQRQNLFQLYA